MSVCHMCCCRYETTSGSGSSCSNLDSEISEAQSPTYSYRITPPPPTSPPTIAQSPPLSLPTSKPVPCPSSSMQQVSTNSVGTVTHSACGVYCRNESCLLRLIVLVGGDHNISSFPFSPTTHCTEGSGCVTCLTASKVQGRVWSAVLLPPLTVQLMSDISHHMPTILNNVSTSLIM